MNMETTYRVYVNKEEMISKVANLWGTEINVCNNYFEDYSTDVLNVMEEVIKVTHKMDELGDKTPFSVIGKCESDYDCIVFFIEYDGEKPTIKSDIAYSSEDDCDFDDDFVDDDNDSLDLDNYDTIRALLKDEKNYTFKEAYEEDVPLGGFLDVSYDEWVDSILQ